MTATMMRTPPLGRRRPRPIEQAIAGEGEIEAMAAQLFVTFMARADTEIAEQKATNLAVMAFVTAEAFMEERAWRRRHV